MPTAPVSGRAVRVVLVDTFRLWSERGGSRLGAALAYYTAFSLAPVLLVVIGVASLLFDGAVARERVIAEVDRLIGSTGAAAVTEMLSASADTGTSGWAVVIGTVTMLLGASTVFYQLQEALDLLWDAPRPRNGLLAELRGRGVSLALVLSLGFLLIVALVVSAVLSAAGDQVSRWQEVAPWVLVLATNAASLLVLGLIFAMVFKVLPRVHVRWPEVIVGAAVTSVLFTLGKGAIGLYLGHSSIGSTFGAAGSFAVLLVWVYYSAQIILLGAAFTRVWSRGAPAAPPPTPTG